MNDGHVTSHRTSSISQISSMDVNERLDSALKSKGMHVDRFVALEKYFYEQNLDIKHGLGIHTEISSIRYGHETLKEGRCDMNIGSSPEDLRSLKIFTLKEFIQASHDDKDDMTGRFGPYKETISRIIKERFSLDGNSRLQDLNKLDYLHMTLADVKILIFYENDEDMISTDKKTLKIERSIEGNSYNHLIIMIGKGSRLELYLRTTHPKNHEDERQDSTVKDGDKIITDFTDIIIGENSKVNIIEQRMFSDTDIVYAHKSAELGESSELNWMNIDKDSRLAFIEQKVLLKGDGSRSVSSNILCGKNSKYTIYNISEHAGKNTESLMQSRCGLRNSKAIVRGLVQIDESAENSNGYQKSDILLMDEESRGISMPDLKIHNDKVKCSHGSSITRLDSEKIFYLESRGLDRIDAERLLIEGFYDKILRDISDEELRESIREEVLK